MAAPAGRSPEHDATGCAVGVFTHLFFFAAVVLMLVTGLGIALAAFAPVAGP
jgi:uncharacterized protein (DUF2062 family)